MKGRIIAAGVLAAVCAAGIAVFMVMRTLAVEDPVAEIRLNGEVIRSISLSGEAEFTVETEGGWNKIEVSGGAVRVTDADCPDRVCIRSGAISGGAVPIICLPHRLEIVIVSGNSSEFDAAV